MRNSLILLFIWILSGSNLWAVRTEKMTDDLFSDFSSGKSSGITITTDGFLKMGPTTQKWISIPASVIWTAVYDSKGNLFVAAGNEGQVFKIGSDGKPVEFFKSKELQIQTLAFDRSDNLYAASVPDGKVYCVNTDGKSSVFFDPKEKYIWALQFDTENHLFVATGQKGRLYKVSSSGKGELFYDSDEIHLRTLLLDEKKRLWVGTEGKGLVYRFDQIDSSSSNPFAAYDSDFREIKAMLQSPDGSIFIAAMGNGKLPISSKPSTKKTVSQNNSLPDVFPTPISGEGSLKIEETTESSSDNGNKPDTSEIVRILPNGTTERWWSGRKDIYCMAMPEPGHLWVGAGNKGKLLEITSPKKFSVLGQIEGETITSLIQRNQTDWLATTSNAGAIWSISTSLTRKGTFESRVFDAHASARWGILDAKILTGLGGIHLETRSGNTAKPDKVWNEWLPLNKGNQIQSPPARFIQYKIIIETNTKSTLSEPIVSVDRVTLYYQTINLPPRITQLSLLQPNIELVKAPKVEFPLSPINLNINFSSLGQFSKPGGIESGDGVSPISGHSLMLQQVKKMGWRSMFWQANDPNDDELRYDVFYRIAGSDHWKNLKENLHESFFSWDAATWPDGEYYAKIIAADQASNPEGQGLTDELTSAPFTVDNTAPTIEIDASPGAIKKGSIVITIHDTTSIIDEAEFSIDNKDWQPLLPIHGLYDSKSNQFRIPINHLPSGDHHVVIRASDSADNIGTETVCFKQ